MTKQEKLVIYFLVAMLVLGLAVKFYKAKVSRIDLKVEKSDLSQEKIDIGKIIREKQIVKINTATVQDFIRLPGIGPALAERIVEYREKNGSFLAIEDLKNVSGIGDKKYDRIKDYLALE